LSQQNVETSANAIAAQLAVVTEFRDGELATRFEMHFSWEQALRAAGLEA
jgi:hypothetical protein